MDNEVNILAAASNYLFEFEKDLKHLSFDQRRALLSEWEASVKNTLLKKPQRGTLIDSNGRELSAVYGAFYFKRAAGDFRRDTVTVLVGLGPYNIVQQITIHRVQAGIDGEVIRSVCGKKGSEYPISQLVAPLGFTLDAGGAGWTYTVPPSGFEAAPFAVRWSSLEGSAIASTIDVGSKGHVVLDPTAAGHDWFIDASPLDNPEYLRTADPNIWNARTGSTAYGNMDLLSVLLHEYGHVLGMEHSGDAHDAMAAVAAARGAPPAHGRGTGPDEPTRRRTALGREERHRDQCHERTERVPDDSAEQRRQGGAFQRRC